MFVVLVHAVGEGHLSSVVILIEHTASSVVVLRLKHAKVAWNIGRGRVGHRRLRELIGHHGNGNRSLLRAALGLSYCHGSSLAAAFNSFVAVFVVLLEVFK